MSEPTFVKTDTDSNAELPPQKIVIEGNIEFPEVTIFQKKERPDEKMVRIYRGVTKNDPGAAEQPPYALRTIDEYGRVTVMKDAKSEVENLANNPSYENLEAYLGKTEDYRTDEQRRRLEADLYQIEERVLQKGWSIRDGLVNSQIGHGGGTADYGLSPYTSSTLDPSEASGYSSAAVLVYEIPVSMIQARAADSEGEVQIKGGLNRNELVAIITHQPPVGRKKLNSEAELTKAISEIDKVLQTAPLSGADFKEALTKQINKEKEFDRRQREDDLSQIRVRRVVRLAGTFPKVKLNLETLAEAAKESSTDIYTQAKYKIFDYYADAYKELIGSDAEIRDEEFNDSKGEKKHFERENISDEMLLKIKKLIQYFQVKKK